jgi:hypothetical protein
VPTPAARLTPTFEPSRPPGVGPSAVGSPDIDPRAKKAPFWVVLTMDDGRLIVQVDRSRGNTDTVGSVEIISLATGERMPNTVAAADGEFELTTHFAHPGEYRFIVHSSSGLKADVFTASVSIAQYLDQPGATSEADSILTTFAEVEELANLVDASRKKKENFFVVFDQNEDGYSLSVDRSAGNTDTIGSVEVIDLETGEIVPSSFVDGDDATSLTATFPRAGSYQFTVTNARGTRSDVFAAQVQLVRSADNAVERGTTTEVRSTAITERSATQPAGLARSL